MANRPPVPKTPNPRRPCKGAGQRSNGREGENTRKELRTQKRNRSPGLLNQNQEGTLRPGTCYHTGDRVHGRPDQHLGQPAHDPAEARPGTAPQKSWARHGTIPVPDSSHQHRHRDHRQLHPWVARGNILAEDPDRLRTVDCIHRLKPTVSRKVTGNLGYHRAR